MRKLVAYCGGMLLTGMLASGCARWPASLTDAMPIIRGDMPNTGGNQPDVSAENLPADEAARLLVVHGDKLVERGREAQAVVQYEKARSLQPDYPGLAHKLAVLYDRLAQDQKALAEYHRAWQQQPNDPNVVNDFGYFHYQRGRYAEAERLFRQALALCEQQASPGARPWWSRPSNKQGWETVRERACVNLGLALAQQDKLQEAFTVFTKVLPPAQAHYNMAVVLLQRAGRLPEEQAAQQQRIKQQARAHLEQALRLDGSIRQARALLEELDNPKPPPDKQPPSKPGNKQLPAAGSSQTPLSPEGPTQLPGTNSTNQGTPPISPSPAASQPVVIHPPPPPEATPTSTSNNPHKRSALPLRRSLRDDTD